MNFTRFFKKKSDSEKALAAYLKAKFGISPKNLEYYKVAFTHSSILVRSKKFIESNERLEFLGDAILDSVVANYLYEVFPKSSEGELTKMKSKVVSRKNLNSLAKELDVDSQLKHCINSNSENTSILGNALEALIGALYLDLGYYKCEKVIMSFLESSNLDYILFEQKDYKSLIHEWCQQNKKEVHFPTVNELMIEGRTHYEVNVILDGEILGKGRASSKKKAQKIAAQEAFLKIDRNE